MIKNYLLIAWRNFLRQKEYSLLNILGLSIGLTCCFVIMLYVFHETTYDQFHAKGDRIFRVIQTVPDDKDWAWTGGVMPSIMKREFKEVEHAVSLHRITTYITAESTSKGEFTARESKFFFTDPAFFQVFDFELVKGSVGKSLEEPFQILITESMATKYFGNDDPIGKTIKTTGDFVFTVTGVLKDMPLQSHLKFDFLTSMQSFKATEGFPATAEFGSHWWPLVWTYVLLDDKSAATKINAQLPEVIKKHRVEDEAKRFVPQLQPMQSIYLHSDMSVEIEPNGSSKTIYIFTGIAVFTLLLACINFMNLATARAIKRMKEIGVRKSIGAQRKQLVMQFFSESFLMNIVALAIAVLLADISLPIFNAMLQKELSLSFSDNQIVWFTMVALVIISSVLSGFYPAVYLSGFKPAAVIKGTHNTGGKALRQFLVVFQFTLSVALVICTTIAWYQVQYFKDARLGFDREHVVMLRAGEVVRKQYDILKDRLNTVAAVKHVTGTSARPGIDAGWGPQVEFEGVENIDRPFIYQQFVDYDFFDVMNIELLAGRGFSKEIQDEGTGTLMRDIFPSFQNRNFVVNEAAVRFMGKTNESVLGMPLRVFTEENGNLYSDTKGIVVGVVKDFNTTDLRGAIRPTVFSPMRSPFGNEVNFITIKLQSGSFSKAIADIEQAWKQVVPQIPMEYTFLDEDINDLYQQETRLGTVIGFFACVTLFISCLGLLGLSAYTVETRTKEIGIRKVLGASGSTIVALLSKDYLRLIALAVVIAIPAGWYIMQQWLDQFAYRVPVHGGLFIFVALITFIVAMLTISSQSIKAAMTNPVKALRSE